jgi:hypothetical protein
MLCPPIGYLCAHTDKTNKNKKGLNLKEEVEQMISDCPTSSNNCNVDSFIICASRGFINPLTGFPRRLKGKAAFRRTGQSFMLPPVEAWKRSQRTLASVTLKS